ncbi:histidine phosphatase family protein [Ensifer sp. LC163]|uniref:histidine phosphatase family protein n=1 Tax=Ensifer sp. LC163 TaxID=1120652 RepID=UPI0008133AF5|nr:histidine phosphatase family protein [Ensifer sp. LC163]OCP38413.1 phosphoglycerate mutase [Ensifer sp. LC163]
MTSPLPNIILIRHGETQWNVAGRLQGRKDTPLTANGVRQALAVGLRLAERIAGETRLKFWVSPLGRARQTASILADTWSVPFEQFTHDETLVERAYGSWEGRSHDEIERELAHEYEAHSADPWDYAMPGGESRTTLDARLLSWLATLDHENTHVVVTHSGCVRALRGIYTRASREEILAYREPQTASFLLSAGKETVIGIPLSILRALGCEGEGRTVWI